MEVLEIGKDHKPGKYYRVVSFARLIGCTRINVYDMISRGSLKAHKILGWIVINPDEARDLFERKPKYAENLRAKFKSAELITLGFGYLVKT